MILFLILLGLFTGSFLGVLVDRIPRNKPFLTGRSYCDFCKKDLSWYDLIPVVSYVLLRGRCRYCRTKLPLFYPIIEVTTGIIFALTYIFIISNSQFLISNEILIHKSEIIDLIYYLFITSALIVIFFTDIKYGIIPDKIIFPAALVTFAWLIISNQPLVINHLLTAVGSFLFLFAVPSLYYLFTKKIGMGGGDIKFAFLMGLILGLPVVIISFYTAFLTGAIFAIILVLWKKKTLVSGKIAFGPFMVFGTFLSMFLGNEIIRYIYLYLGI